MKGHVRKQGKGYRYVIDLPRGLDGKRNQKWSKTFATKKQAEHAVAEKIAEVSKGAYFEPSTMPLQKFLQRWLDNHARHNCTEKTVERYDQYICNQIAPRLGQVKLCDLRPLHIQDCYSSLLKTGRVDGKGGLSPCTVHHIHRLLNNALNTAVKLQLLPTNPAQAARPPRASKREMAALTKEESVELLERLDGKELQLPVRVALMTGLRRGELLGLKWDDIDFETGRVNIKRALKQTGNGLTFEKPKTERSSRTITLPRAVLGVLGSHKAQQAEQKLSLGPAYQDNNLIFATQDGSPVPPDRLSRQFADFINRNPTLTKVRFHDLRHTHASLLLQQNEHAKVVSERLGHSSVAFTLDTYGHLMPGMQEGAAIKLDAMFADIERKKSK